MQGHPYRGTGAEVIISLDLDGVLCDLSSATLCSMHVLHRLGQVNDEDLRTIYAKALPKAHPSRFSLLEDKVIIITGRLPIAHRWTFDWLLANGMGEYSVECVGDRELEKIWAGGDPDGASRKTAVRKARVCQRCNVDLHVDNNPEVVRHMRALGVNAVCVRL